MPSFRLDREEARALQHKLRLLDELTRAYAGALEAMLESDLDLAAQQVGNAEPILDELQRNEKILTSLGVETPPEIRQRSDGVRDLHSRLIRTIAEEQTTVTQERARVATARRTLRGHDRSHARTGQRLDSCF